MNDINLNTKELFERKKNELIDFAVKRSQQQEISELERESLHKCVRILDKYQFSNRLHMKGLLSHTIVDSLSLDWKIAEEFIQFDDAIC